jgi:hypothetical protein
LENQDHSDVLRALSAEGVDFIIVGAHALAVHGRPRATGDLDILVRCDSSNSLRVFKALVRFGAPMEGIDERTFTDPNLVLQLGQPPYRIDLLTGIDGVSFDECWTNRMIREVDGIPVPVPVIGYRELVLNKAATNRPQDQADLAWLRAHPPTGSP